MLPAQSQDEGGGEGGKCWAQVQVALRSDFEMKGELELGEWDESSPQDPPICRFLSS